MAARSLQAWRQTVTSTQAGKLNPMMRERSKTYIKLKLSLVTDHDRGVERSSQAAVKPYTRKAVNLERSKEITEEASNGI